MLLLTVYLEWTDVVVYFKWPDLNFLYQSSWNLTDATPPLHCIVFYFMLPKCNTFSPYSRQVKFEFHILMFDGQLGPPNQMQTFNLQRWTLNWSGRCLLDLLPLLMPPISYLFSPDTLLIWSQLHHLRARVHYNKSVVSCQSCSRCKMEPVWDLSNKIKGPLCKIGLDLWFLHCYKLNTLAINAVIKVYIHSTIKVIWCSYFKSLKHFHICKNICRARVLGLPSRHLAMHFWRKPDWYSCKYGIYWPSCNIFFTQLGPSK